MKELHDTAPPKYEYTSGKITQVIMNRGNGLPAFAFRQAVMVPDLEQRTSQRTQRYNLTKGKRDDSLVKQVSHKHSSQTHADYKHDSTANSPFKPSVY